jgi:hypothetical protein
VYESVDHRRFTTICKANVNKVLERDEFPEWRPNQFQWEALLLLRGRELSPLREEHFEGKTAAELDIMRNTIFARRGLIFQREDLARHFASQPWYRPSVTHPGEIEPILSVEERYEALLIARYQKKHGLRMPSGSARDMTNAEKKPSTE